MNEDGRRRRTERTKGMSDLKTKGSVGWAHNLLEVGWEGWDVEVKVVADFTSRSEVRYIYRVDATKHQT